MRAGHDWSRLVLVLFLIGCESGANSNFASRSQSVVKQKESKPGIALNNQIKKTAVIGLLLR